MNKRKTRIGEECKSKIQNREWKERKYKLIREDKDDGKKENKAE